jgi:hypothetical protein
MGMVEGRAKLGKSIKEMLMHWNETKLRWNDATARGFESKYVTPTEMDARTALNQMDHMAQVLQQIKHDCT